MTKNFTSLFSKIVAIALTLVIAFGSVSSAFAQAANPPSVASYDQMPVKGQMIVPAGKGWVAPESWNGLNVTIWYGVKADTVATMANLGAGIAQDRARNYGGSESDYPTVVWSGTAVAISGNNCRPEFYSDATILTAGVVYGDQCPLLIEYNVEGHFVAAPTLAAAIDTVVPSTPLPISTPTALVSPTPTISVEASVTPSVATPTSDPNVVYQKDVTITNNGLLWFGILLLAAGFFGLLFRRSSVPVEPVAPKATTTRRKPATKKTKSTKK